MRACVVVFPGSNAEPEMVHTLASICGAKTTVAWHTETELPQGTDLVAIPGGFSYGDYLRCGALARVSPIVGAIRAHGERGGFILGVCNGFQILTEIGLLPGALTRNLHLRFECRDIHVKVTADGAFTRIASTKIASPKITSTKITEGAKVASVEPSVWRLPIAHAEGRYQASEAVLKKLEGEGLIALRYSTPLGEITADANPNGSLHNIAGIYGGVKKNIFGLMPHPERMSESLMGGTDGRKLFDAILAAA